MNCPKCHTRTKVNYTAAPLKGMKVYRRRVCPGCGWTGFTVEKVEEESHTELYGAKTERLHQREVQADGGKM